MATGWEGMEARPNMVRTLAIRVDSVDQVGDARRRAGALAAAAGLDESDAGRAALVASECATNLVKHAGGGEILLQPLEGGIEILALDKGPGMPNPALCFQDGYSTAGSAGTGLGAVQRLSSECHVYTEPQKGAALLARIRKRNHAPRPVGPLDAGAVCIPKTGEEECGDGWVLGEGSDFATAMVVDGLGHGPFAAKCATAAAEAFAGLSRSSPAEIMAGVHAALRPTRGAAVAVLRLDWDRRHVLFAGIGNVAACIVDGGRTRQMVSHPGIVGHDVRNVRELTYDWAPGSTVLVYSDGIATHWSLDAYQGIASRDAALIAGVVYRDWNRGRDDATVLVLREGKGQ